MHAGPSAAQPRPSVAFPTCLLTDGASALLDSFQNVQHRLTRSWLLSTRICSLLRQSSINTFCSTQPWAICEWPICTVYPFQQAGTRPDLLIILKPFRSIILKFTDYFSTIEALLRGNLRTWDSLGEATSIMTAMQGKPEQKHWLLLSIDFETFQ